MRSFVHANEQRKQQPVQQAVPAKQNVQQVQKVGGNLITRSDNVVTTPRPPLPSYCQMKITKYQSSHWL